MRGRLSSLAGVVMAHASCMCTVLVVASQFSRAQLTSGPSGGLRDPSTSLPHALTLDMPMEDDEGAEDIVRLTLDRHAEPDMQPFVIEPREIVSDLASTSHTRRSSDCMLA